MISQYEKKRKARIAENQQKLHDIIGEGTLGKIGALASPRTPTRKRAPRAVPTDAPAHRMSRRSSGRVAQADVAAISSEDEDEVELAMDMSKIVADLRASGKIGGQVASAEEVAGSREAFKRRYVQIKGGTYKQWAVERSIKEGGRADYAAKDAAKRFFGAWVGNGPKGKKKRVGLNYRTRLKPGHLAHMPNGAVFFSRAEMEALGFHSKQMNGIDYCSAKDSCYKDEAGEPMSYGLTVVSSGGYEDDNEAADGSWLWYTGEGKNDLNSSRRQQGNQSWTGGNLALLNSYKLSLPVRLARYIGQDRVESYSGRKFVYDGLYDVKEVKQEKGTQGFTVVKFLLWRQTNKENGKLRPGAVAPTHSRIVQLGARDGSGEKRALKAAREQQETLAKLGDDAPDSGKQAPSGKRQRRLPM